jgi:glycosyltransferase involved in cell wall biosynthesis
MESNPINKKILIFIPAYNVEKELFSVIKRIPKKIFKNKNLKVLIINDNSSDQTNIEIVKIKKKFKFPIRSYKTNKNLGYGGVQKFAFDYAINNKFDIVIMLHGDGQYKPESLPKIINIYKNDKIDAVFGSRMMSYKSALKGGMPIYKFLGNIFLTFFQNLILGSNMSEFHSGYRSYRVSKLKKINFKNKSNYYHFDTEMIIEFLNKKFNIFEISQPTYYGNEISHLKSIPYGLSVLWVTFKSKFDR